MLVLLGLQKQSICSEVRATLHSIGNSAAKVPSISFVGTLIFPLVTFVLVNIWFILSPKMADLRHFPSLLKNSLGPPETPKVPPICRYPWYKLVCSLGFWRRETKILRGGKWACHILPKIPPELLTPSDMEGACPPPEQKLA